MKGKEPIAFNRLQGSLAGTNVRDTFIYRYGLIQSPAHRLENRLQNMVFVFTVMTVNVKVHSAAYGKCAEKLIGQEPIKAGKGLARRRQMIHKEGALGQIQGNRGQGVIHGSCGKAVATDSFSGAQSAVQRIAHNKPHIFNRVMEIHFDIPFGNELQIKKTMHGKKTQHMIEKRDAR